MRLLEKMCFVLLASGLALGQATATNSGSAGTGSVADELKALREAISQQQKQISQQQQQIQVLEQQLENKTSGTPHVADAAMRTAPLPVKATVVQETEKPKESPLSFRIGGTDFTPGGFVDFENIFRTTNTGNVTATSFGAIPFSPSVQGHLTEFRSTGQYSRFNLKISGKYGANNVVGYVEGDFNGNDATNVFVSSNPHTNRLRLYWMDLKRGKWEFLGGQTWGLQTPNRVGLSPMPADIFVTLGEDAQTHVGLPYTRAAEFRAVYHFSDHFQWGVALQNPQQFTNGEVVFPANGGFSAQLGSQFDAGGTPGAPNAFPDIHTKMAWDTDNGGKHMHFEAGGLLTSAKITTLAPSGTANATFVHDTKIGAAFHGAFNVELLKGFRVLANGMWGDGDGRYLIGFGPQAVVFATNASGFTCTVTGTTATGCDAKLSMVHAGAAIVGSELQVKKSQFGFYYGGFYYQRNSFPDLTVAPNAAGLRPNIGFGFYPVTGPTPALSFAGSNSTNNRAIQEATIDWTQTFWKNPQYGAVLLVTQTSYVTRAPWFVAAGAPKNAHLMMGYVSLKYVLP